MKSANALKLPAIMEKSELEGLFLECVDEVRKEVMRRRAKSIMRTKYPLKTGEVRRYKKALRPTISGRYWNCKNRTNKSWCICTRSSSYPSDSYTGRQAGKQGDLGKSANLAQLETKCIYEPKRDYHSFPCFQSRLFSSRSGFAWKCSVFAFVYGGRVVLICSSLYLSCSEHKAQFS